jgi:hypothetical protein
MREWASLLQSIYVHVQIIKNVKLPIIKSPMTAYTTPCTLFEGWQDDLVRSLPISPQRFSYVLTGVVASI